jgi:hypothetical protein
LQINGTTVIDSSRNLTNIGTISSGAITSSGSITSSGAIISTNTGNRLDALSIGDDSDIYLYESLANVLTIRTGASGSYKYFTFQNDGYFNTGSGGISTGGTGRITSDGNLTNIGTISSGSQTITSDTYTKIYSSTNGASSGLRFSDHAGGSYAQYGDIRYYHADGSSYGSGNAFVFTSSEPTTTILADGKLMFKEGLYLKPSSGTGAGTQIINSSRNFFANNYYYLNGQIMAQGTDNYLRINQSNQFSSGVWFGSSNIYNATDKYIATGSNGGTTSSRVYMYGGTYNGSNVIALVGS